MQCIPNFYGKNCSESCGSCANDDICDIESGHCPGPCAPGFQQPTCTESCEHDRFGKDCSGRCHCRNNEACDPLHGTCPNGCASGFKGKTCSTPVKQKNVGDDSGPSAGLIGGVAVTVVVAVVIVIITAIVIRKKRRNKLKYLEANINYGSTQDGDDTPNHIAVASCVTPGPTESQEALVRPVEMETSIAIKAKSLSALKPAIAKKPELKRTAETIIYTNMEPNQVLSNPIPVRSFQGFMAREKSSDCTTLKNEYMSIPSGKTASWNVASDQGLILKNKFKNILPYDWNRVVLSPVGEESLSHYINASFVDGYTKAKKFIASHGPREPTKNDFWRMIWQYDVAVIVMVTNLVEEGKEKCIKYWPVDGERSYGELTVTPVAEEEWQDYVVRDFTIAKGTEERRVSQFHYIGWPDHGVPMLSSGLLTMVHRVKSHTSRHEMAPVVVHCSAGVGRTGTFIALDWLLDQADKEKRVDVLGCVSKLRMFRINMVQSIAQYIYIYDTMNETLLLGQTSICCNEIDSVYHNLSDSEKRENKLEVQYKYLEDSKPYFVDEEFDTATTATNEKLNRDMTILPAEKHRVFLNIDGRDIYINAVTIQGYRTESKYYATQLPMEETATTFWQMIWQYQISTIVALESTDDCGWFPGKDEILFYGGYELRATNINNQGGISVYTIEITLQSEPTEYYNIANQVNARVISLFVLRDTDDSQIGTSIISTYIKIMSQGPTERSSTTVACRNGARLTCMYIACSILFDMCSAEQEFDVFQVVQKIRRTRPQFIGSLEQYKQLYEIVKEFTATESEYFNVK